MFSSYWLKGKRLQNVGVGLIVLFTYLTSTALVKGEVVSDTLDKTVVTDGIVYAIAETNDTLYIGGNFSLVGPTSGGGVPVSPTTGLPESSFPQFNGSVSVAIPDGAGGCYVGGTFTRVGNLYRTNLVHILSDRTVDPNWKPSASGSYVKTMLIEGDVLYIGGNFTNVNGQVRNRLAALVKSTGELTSWNPNANSYVNSIAAHGTNIYVGGNFTSVGGQTREYLAALSMQTGLATSWNPAPWDWVESVKVSGDRLFVGGYFGGIAGQTRSLLASFSLPAATLESWNPNVGTGSLAIIYSMVVTNDTVFIGGNFSLVGTSNRVNVAAVDANTGLAKPWTAQLTYYSFGSANYLAVNGNTLYVGGSISHGGAQKRFYTAGLDISTAALTTWNPKLNFLPGVFCSISNGMFLGGSFGTVSGVERTNLAAFNMLSGQVTSWNPVASTNVLALQPYGSKMYIGGEFRTINGIIRSNLASVDINSGAVSSWAPNANLYVTSLATWNNRLYAGGAFTNVFGIGRTNLVEFDADTGSMTGWDPVLNRAFVRTLLVHDDTLYAGGLISTVNGEIRRRVAAFDLSSGTPTLSPWNPVVSTTNASIIEGIVRVDDKVYLSGRFTYLNGFFRTNIACVDATTAQVLPFGTTSDQPIYAMAVISNTVLVGGDFLSIGGKSQPYLAALDATTGALSSWNPRASAFVRTMRVAKGVVYVGGAFYTGLTGRGIASYPISVGTPSITGSSFVRHPNGSVQFAANGYDKARLTVSASTNLTSWEPLYSLPLTNGTAQFLDTEAAPYASRFYRVSQQ